MMEKRRNKTANDHDNESRQQKRLFRTYYCRAHVFTLMTSTKHRIRGLNLSASYVFWALALFLLAYGFLLLYHPYNCHDYVHKFFSGCRRSWISAPVSRFCRIFYFYDRRFRNFVKVDWLKNLVSGLSKFFYAQLFNEFLW